MQILRHEDSINYIVELVGNITNKNMALAHKKARNLLYLEKERELASLSDKHKIPSSVGLNDEVIAEKHIPLTDIFDASESLHKIEDKRKNSVNTFS